MRTKTQNSGGNTEHITCLLMAAIVGGRSSIGSGRKRKRQVSWAAAEMLEEVCPSAIFMCVFYLVGPRLCALNYTTSIHVDSPLLYCCCYCCSAGLMMLSAQQYAYSSPMLPTCHSDPPLELRTYPVRCQVKILAWLALCHDHFCRCGWATSTAI